MVIGESLESPATVSITQFAEIVRVLQAAGLLTAEPSPVEPTQEEKDALQSALKEA